MDRDRSKFVNHARPNAARNEEDDDPIWCWLPQITGMIVNLVIVIIFSAALCAATNVMLFHYGDPKDPDTFSTMLMHNVGFSIEVVVDIVAIIALAIKVNQILFSFF